MTRLSASVLLSLALMAAAVAAPGAAAQEHAGTAPRVGEACPAAVHDGYTAVGPDGQSYPTWHPAVDPASGCWFGHEHGDDPTGAPALGGRPVLFGYAGTQVGQNVAHAGFKVFRWDNVQGANAPNHAGASVVMTVHQGTAGPVRFTEPSHEVSVDYLNPRDGREAHVRVLAPFGTLAAGCGANDPAMALKMPQMDGPGMRQVAADACYTTPRSPYEDWITALYVGRDDAGKWRAYLDPHFAVFDPNTYCVVAGGACTLGYSDARAGTGADPKSPEAQFKGVKREAYLNQVWLDNAGGSPTFWTDVYGRLVPEGTAGAVQQFVASVSARPLGNSLAFGAERRYDDGTVRAPN